MLNVGNAGYSILGGDVIHYDSKKNVEFFSFN